MSQSDAGQVALFLSSDSGTWATSTLWLSYLVTFRLLASFSQWPGVIDCLSNSLIPELKSGTYHLHSHSYVC